MNINYEELLTPKTSSSTGLSKAEFFKLKTGETAIVRFPYTTTSDFEIVRFHEIPVQGQLYPIKVECNRKDIYEAADACELCKQNVKLVTKFFVKMITYVVDSSTGSVTLRPVVWERPIGFAKDLASFVAEYGDITNMLFKLTRTGAGLDTRYSLIPIFNTAVYSPEIYKKDFSLLDNTDVHRMFLKKYDKYLEEEGQGSAGPVESDETNDLPYTPAEAVQQPVQQPQFQQSQETSAQPELRQPRRYTY